MQQKGNYLSFKAKVLLHNLPRVGAHLMENSPVKSAVFDKEKGIWTAYIENSTVMYQVSY